MTSEADAVIARVRRDVEAALSAPVSPREASPSRGAGQASATADGQPREQPGPDLREALGRIVRETWVAWASEQPDLKPSWLVPWDELDGGQREVDMRIGEAVAAAERERIRQMAVRNNAVCVGDEGTCCYFADLLGGGELPAPEEPAS